MAHAAALVAVIALLLLSVLASDQPPNTLAKYNPNRRTNSMNATWFIVPIAKSKLKEAIKDYGLAPLPLHDKSIFPHKFPTDSHPILITVSYLNDLRRGNLQIDALTSGSIIAPYVDRLGDGTPFNYPLVQYISGANGEDVMGVVPGIVGSINTNPVLLAKNVPDDAPYSGIDANKYSAQVKKITVPNPISGPGVVPHAIDLLFSSTNRPKFPARAYHNMINQPLILTSNLLGQCQNNVIYFNESFANPIMRKGTVTLYSPSVPKSVVGVYESQNGYSATGEQVAYANQNCRAAAKSFDPKAKL